MNSRMEDFVLVKALGLSLPGVEASTRWDGSPVLKLGGAFMAGLTTHPSAEPGSLVVRISVDERDWLLADAPEIYYVTDHHQDHPVVLVRLSRIDRDALRELLSMAWRVTQPKARPDRKQRGDARSPSSSSAGGSIPAGSTRGRRTPDSRARRRS